MFCTGLAAANTSNHYSDKAAPLIGSNMNTLADVARHVLRIVAGQNFAKYATSPLSSPLLSQPCPNGV